MRLPEQVALTGCTWDAIEFLLRSVPTVRAKWRGRDREQASTSAAELCWGLVDHARHRFGSFAADTLYAMGLRDSKDIGKIIYAMAAAEFLTAEPSDRPEDFNAVLDVRAAIAKLESGWRYCDQNENER